MTTSLAVLITAALATIATLALLAHRADTVAAHTDHRAVDREHDVFTGPADAWEGLSVACRNQAEAERWWRR